MNYSFNNIVPDASAGSDEIDVIDSVTTLDQLFKERVRRSSERVAYAQFDVKQRLWVSLTWRDLGEQVYRWRQAFRQQALNKGDRVAICHRNSIEWVAFGQAALSLGLVVVPLYTIDRAENLAYMLSDSGAKLVAFSQLSTWQAVCDTQQDLSAIETVVVLGGDDAAQAEDARVIDLHQWLSKTVDAENEVVNKPDDLASIVYTSGTTGPPKGVMLSHKNMLSNARAGLASVTVTCNDHFLSFLPLSHTLERTVGYYAAMTAGARVTFSRSVQELAKDLIEVKPTIIISVPRIFERVESQIYRSLVNMSGLKNALFNQAVKTGWHSFEHKQGVAAWHPRLIFTSLLDRLVARNIRDRLGGRLRLAIVGGAPLSVDVAKTFVGLGVPILQGYGLTETSPIVSVNTLEKNRPDSIGLPLQGVQVKVMANDELWVKGDNVMLGYWKEPASSNAVLVDGWARTGDRATIDDNGFIKIIGRIKDILVLANGEKVPPANIEAAICRDSLFEQVIVLGEGQSYLSALVVLEPEQWKLLASDKGFDHDNPNDRVVSRLILNRITEQMKSFPAYARVRQVHVAREGWNIENGLLTPTLKLKRDQIQKQYQAEIENMSAAIGVKR